MWYAYIYENLIVSMLQTHLNNHTPPDAFAIASSLSAMFLLSDIVLPPLKSCIFVLCPMVCFPCYRSMLFMIQL